MSPIDWTDGEDARMEAYRGESIDDPHREDECEGPREEPVDEREEELEPGEGRIGSRISLHAFLREDIRTIRQTLADIGMAIGVIEGRLHSLGAVAEDCRGTRDGESTNERHQISTLTTN